MSGWHICYHGEAGKSVVGAAFLIFGFGVYDLSSRITTIASTQPAVQRMRQAVPTRQGSGNGQHDSDLRSLD